jgi:hypothetical protein
MGDPPLDPDALPERLAAVAALERGMNVLTDQALEQIEQRARLWLDWGDRDAFRPDDCQALLAEARHERAALAHAQAMIRQLWDQLGEAKVAAWAARQRGRR